MGVFAKIGRLAVAWFRYPRFWQVFRTTFRGGLGTSVAVPYDVVRHLTVDR